MTPQSLVIKESPFISPIYPIPQYLESFFMFSCYHFLNDIIIIKISIMIITININSTRKNIFPKNSRNGEIM